MAASPNQPGVDRVRVAKSLRSSSLWQPGGAGYAARQLRLYHLSTAQSLQAALDRHPNLSKDADARTRRMAGLMQGEWAPLLPPEPPLPSLKRLVTDARTPERGDPVVRLRELVRDTEPAPERPEGGWPLPDEPPHTPDPDEGAALQPLFNVGKGRGGRRSGPRSASGPSQYRRAHRYGEGGSASRTSEEGSSEDAAGVKEETPKKPPLIPAPWRAAHDWWRKRRDEIHAPKMPKAAEGDYTGLVLVLIGLILLFHWILLPMSGTGLTRVQAVLGAANGSVQINPAL